MAPFSKIKTGSKIICTYAATNYYTVGKTYEVVLDEKSRQCVKGSDGFLDVMSVMNSKFKPYEGEPPRIEMVTK